MIIFYGTRLYGKTSEVRGGLFHISTQFFHIYLIPLLPVRSYVVLESHGDQFRGVSIGWNLKSILITWLRLALAIAAIVFFAMASSTSPGNGAWMHYTGAGLSIVLFIATYLLPQVRYASYVRAHALAERIGMNEAGKVAIDLAYGIITEQEAEEAMAALHEQRREELLAAAEAERPSDSQSSLEGLQQAMTPAEGQ